MTRLAFALFVVAIIVLTGHRAFAEQNNPKATPVYVLDIDTDDSDDQADALTQALRARVRQAPGWTLAETTQSLGKLIVVLKCPPKPDAACLQRIGDQIKADRFVWGQMTKRGKEVTIDLHLWTRGKPEARASETYSDNLKDPNDDGLKKIAAKLFATVTGSATTGTVTVRVQGSAAGLVLVDGQERAKLVDGVAKLDVPAGAHTVEVRASGFENWSQQVTVNAAAEQEVTATLVPGKPGGEPPPTATSPAPWRKIAGWVLVGVGGATLIVAGYEGIKFLGAKSDLDNDRSQVSTTVTDVCADLSTPAAIDGCSKYKDARDARSAMFIAGGIGVALAAAGVVLLVTDKPSSSGQKDQAVRVVPMLSPKAAGVDVSIRF
jgi:hypothetical protein